MKKTLNTLCSRAGYIFFSCREYVLVISSAVKWLITSKIKVFVYIICVCTVYMYYIYKYTHMHILSDSLSVSCVSPLVPIFGQFLFLSSFVIISSQPCVFSWLVPSPVLLIILFAPSFPSLYKSSVFPVSLSSINVIPYVCTCLQRSPCL